ncbi:hypothetical protein ACH5RR_037138 [Cinchona calisaya]|uniref:Uncharacterized protein n=1 Tax=Cinchona calisaya TaxID=153742 RepID=A0ABD2Y8X5_9GENT
MHKMNNKAKENKTVNKDCGTHPQMNCLTTLSIGPRQKRNCRPSKFTIAKVSVHFTRKWTSWHGTSTTSIMSTSHVGPRNLGPQSGNAPMKMKKM